MWPRRKNTRGGEDEDSDGEGGATETETEARSTLRNGIGKSPRKRGSDASAREEASRRDEVRRQALKDISNDGSLEARMAAEGRKLRAATGVADSGKNGMTSARSMVDDTNARRGKLSRNLKSTEQLKMPGQFD